jgi:hypothetical protein
LRQQPPLLDEEISERFLHDTVGGARIKRARFPVCNYLAYNWKGELDKERFIEPLRDQIELGNHFDDDNWAVLYVLITLKDTKHSNTSYKTLRKQKSKELKVQE